MLPTSLINACNHVALILLNFYFVCNQWLCKNDFYRVKCFWGPFYATATSLHYQRHCFTFFLTNLNYPETSTTQWCKSKAASKFRSTDINCLKTITIAIKNEFPRYRWDSSHHFRTYNTGQLYLIN
jgi:hypothetical protein